MLLYRLLHPQILSLEAVPFKGGRSVSPAIPSAFAMNPGAVAINHTHEAKIRLNGKVSTTQVQASDAGHAKKLVQAQFGTSVTVLSVKRVD
jgi:hypothetical protein